jgi:LysM repeat protein
MEYSIPISQIIDVPGADENCKYIMKGEILSHDEQIHSENEENPGMISTEIRIAATVMAYTEKELGVVSDIYSTDHNLKTESAPLKISRLKNIIKESFSHKSSVDLPETSASKIVDVWSDACSAKADQQSGKILFKGKMNLCILALDADSIPFYIERVIEFEHSRENANPSENIMAEIEIVPTSIGYSMQKDNKIDVKIDFDVSGAVYLDQKHNMITSAEADESKPADKDCKASLTLYFASESEPLWDIARKYYTSVNAIKQENDISEDVSPKNSMLLIPMR